MKDLIKVKMFEESTMNLESLATAYGLHNPTCEREHPDWQTEMHATTAAEDYQHCCHLQMHTISSSISISIYFIQGSLYMIWDKSKNNYNT
jgi:hypothetical protein